MVQFTETFEYANGDLDGVSAGAWDIVDSANQADGIAVLQNAATNKGTDAAVAFYGTAAATESTDVLAYVAAFEEGTGSTLDVGLAGAHAATYAAVIRGIYARLHFQVDGVRTLSIRRRLKNDASDTELASVDLVLSGGIEAPGYEGRLVVQGGTDLGELQALRLTLTATAYGMLARAYVNQSDLARPTLEQPVASDFVQPDGSTNGAWWFGFGAATAANKLQIAAIAGADFEADADTVPQEIRDDQVTLAELRKRVRNLYDKGQNSATGDERIDYALNDSIEQALNTIGDVAWFMRRQEDVDLEPDAVTGEVTMPVKMERVVGLRVAATGCPARFEFRRLTTDGALVLHLPGRLSQEYAVDYVIRHRSLTDEHQVCPIPRRHSEMIVVGAALRLAEVDRNKEFHRNQLGRYGELERLFLQDNARHSNQTRTLAQPRLRSLHPGRVLRRGRWW